jgi:hypothetical protein
MKIKQTILVLALLIGIGGFFMAPIVSAASCDGVDTSVIDCSSVTKGANGVEKLFFLIIDILTAGVGVAAVGGIIYASILYASAGDSSEQTKKSISTIINVAIGLVAYALMYVFLNFIIPGGKF